jgi:hypothetical protein
LLFLPFDISYTLTIHVATMKYLHHKIRFLMYIFFFLSLIQFPNPNCLNGLNDEIESSGMQ